MINVGESLPGGLYVGECWGKSRVHGFKSCHVHHQFGNDLLLPSCIMAYLVESLVRSACTHALHSYANTHAHTHTHTSTSYVCVHTCSGTNIGSPLNWESCTYSFQWGHIGSAFSWYLHIQYSTPHPSLILSATCPSLLSHPVHRKNHIVPLVARMNWTSNCRANISLLVCILMESFSAVLC